MPSLLTITSSAPTHNPPPTFSDLFASATTPSRRVKRMTGHTSTLLLITLTVFSLLTGGGAFDVFLMNITIYRDHERSIPFITNHPEVYLSCDDGRSPIDLEHVNDENRPYLFNIGDVLATTVSEDDVCVGCRLREEDAGILKDDSFGDFPLCYHQFTKTGDHVAFVPDEFLMGFQCPDCLVVPNPEPAPAVEPTELAPAPEPDFDEDLEYEIEVVAAPPSIEAADEETEEEDPTGQYYYFTSSSVKNSDDQVGLQSENEGTQTDVEEGSKNGLSTATVLSLCFVFLVVGVAAGVLVFWKYSVAVAHDKMAVSAFELTKIGYVKSEI